DIDSGANRPSFINDARTARRQRCPADIIATRSPRNPGWSPIQIGSRKPDPAVIPEVRPATIVICGPAEVFVGNPRPAVIGVSPIAIAVRPPVRIAHCRVWLPTVSVAFDVDPVSTGKIVIDEINCYVGSARLRKSRHNKSQ